jgi:long-subunit fatty acid transport protein
MTFWSAVEEWDIAIENGGLNGGTSPITNLKVPFGWDDQVRLAGGFDYAARENVMVRGGAYYESGASVDSTFSPNFPNDGDAFGLSGGVAYTINGHMELAMAQELAFYSKRTIDSYAGADGVTAFPGEYSFNRYETIFSLTYRF